MTTPTITESKWAEDYTDYLKSPGARDGSAFNYKFDVTIPSGTVVSVNVGLMPFQKGFRFNPGSFFANIDNVGDGSFTFDLGWIYEDEVTYTSDPNGIASALTTGQAGGLITLDEDEVIDFVAEANGWIVLVTGGSTTDNAGAISGYIGGDYDGG